MLSPVVVCSNLVTGTRNVAQPDGQVLGKASEFVSQLLEPHPRQQQVASPQQAENQLQQEQRQNPQGNVNLDQDNNAAQPNQPQGVAGRGEKNPQSDTVPASRPLEGRSPETCQIIRRLLRAIPLASNTQREEMYNVLPAMHRQVIGLPPMITPTPLPPPVIQTRTPRSRPHTGDPHPGIRPHHLPLQEHFGSEQTRPVCRGTDISMSGRIHDLA